MLNSTKYIEFLNVFVQQNKHIDRCGKHFHYLQKESRCYGSILEVFGRDPNDLGLFTEVKHMSRILQN